MKIVKNIVYAAVVLFCASLSHGYGAEFNPGNQVKFDDEVTFRACDGNEFKVLVKYASLSETIKNLIEDTGIKKVIPLQNVTGRILGSYIIPALEALDKSNNGTEETGELLQLKATLKEMSLEDLVELILNANFLDIKPLFDMACVCCAQKIKQEVNGDELQRIMRKKNIPKLIQGIISGFIIKNIFHEIKTYKGDHYFKFFNFNSDSSLYTLNQYSCNVNLVEICSDNKIILIEDVDPKEQNTNFVCTVLMSHDRKSFRYLSNDKTMRDCKILELNTNYKKIEENLIMQSWLVNLLIHGENECFTIETGSVQEVTWNILPQTTRKILKNKLTIDTQNRFNSDNYFSN